MSGQPAGCEHIKVVGYHEKTVPRKITAACYGHICQNVEPAVAHISLESNDTDCTRYGDTYVSLLSGCGTSESLIFQFQLAVIAMPEEPPSGNKSHQSGTKSAVTRFDHELNHDDILSADFELSESASCLGLSGPLGVIGEYMLLEQIGSGGMGDVFRAEHRTMSREVAIKILNESISAKSNVVQRFFEEIRVVARMMHPNIVTAFDAGTSNGMPYLVMELVDGDLLSQRVVQSGPFSLQDAVSVLYQAARALEYAHSLGVIHRDIKPNNMMLSREGTLKVLDFGLARFTQSETPASSGRFFMGTAAYMPPEQVEDAERADARSDLYSLGATLFFLLTGRPMFRGEQMQVARAQVREKPPALYSLRGDIDLRLDAIFQRLVAKSPGDRIPSARALLEAIDQLNLRLPPNSNYDPARCPTVEQILDDRPTSYDSGHSTVAKSVTASGIDLGMVSSTVAYFEPTTGLHVVVQEGGGEQLRNMLWSDQDRIVVGSEAVKLRQTQPEMIFHSVQRWIGLQQIDRPFGGRRVSPEVLLATILHRLMGSLRECTLDASHSVVTIPDCADQLHRAAVKHACGIAGIELLQLLDKSLAAAVAWIDLNSRISTLRTIDLRANPTLLVLHLGGSGLEASVLQTHGLTASAKASYGYKKLGVLRWQSRLAEHYADLIQKKTGQSIREDVGAATRLQRTVEIALDRLAKSPRVDIRFDWRQQTIQDQLTQAKFFELTSALGDSIRRVVLGALVDASIEATAIDQVILVGSLVAIEPISNLLRILLPHHPPVTRLQKSDLARGAALHAQQLVRFDAASVTLPRAIGCTTYDLGIMIADPVTRVQQPRTLIARGTALPVNLTRTLRSIGSRSKISLQIVEGTTGDATTWLKLGSVDATASFPERKSDQPLLLQLTVDESGMLSASLHWPAGRQQVSFPLLIESNLSPGSIASWREWLAQALSTSENLHPSSKSTES